MSSKSEYDQVDLSSLSNSTQAITTHIKLEWDLNFDIQQISGFAEHTIKILVAGTAEVNFDSSKINLVGDVLLNDIVAKHSISKEHPTLGTKISVPVPVGLRHAGALFNIRFYYSIDSSASAVQWLEASATKGGSYPYIFTQCQAIHARSLLPCMDSPGIKATYSAVVTAPKWCTVLMSALADNSVTAVDSEDKRSFAWSQPVPTPAYLIALAAGHLASRDISDRVRIWSEPEVVDAAHYEFAETEDFLTAAEEITGCPYQWGRYDVLCLPPSFPYGGMENPCLTFATPTLLAGDRSLADVIAHEIAHSWTGNLVTNHTWSHFWLNEGWTVWLERKIACKVRKDEEYGRLSAQIGWKALKDDVARGGPDGGAFSSLVWPLTDQDPDDAFSRVPYEKGFNLLNYLESLIGREHFEAFAKSYIDKFKFSTVTSGQFKDHFLAFCQELATPQQVTTESKAEVEATPSNDGKGKKNNKKNKNKKPAAPTAASNSVVTEIPALLSAEVFASLAALDWEQLLHGRGLPTYTPDFSNSLSITAEELARKWIAAAAQSLSSLHGASAKDVQGWSTMQMSVFLETLQVFPKEQGIEQEDFYTDAWLRALDSAYGFSERKNAEVQLRWQIICLGSEVQWIVPHVVEFITSQGRMKYVRPLYRALRYSTIGGRLAVETFEQNKNKYHPIARKMLAVDLAAVAEMELKEQEAADSDKEEQQTEILTLDDISSLPTDATVVGSSAEQQYTHHPTAEESAEILNHDLVLSPSQDNMSILTTESNDTTAASSPSSSPRKEDSDTTSNSPLSSSSPAKIMSTLTAASDDAPGSLSDAAEWSTKFDADHTDPVALPVKPAETVAETSSASPVKAEANPVVVTPTPVKKIDDAAVQESTPAKDTTTVKQQSPVAPSAPVQAEVVKKQLPASIKEAPVQVEAKKHLPAAVKEAAPVAPAAKAASSSNTSTNTAGEGVVSKPIYRWVGLFALVGILGFGYLRWRRV